MISAHLIENSINDLAFRRAISIEKIEANSISFVPTELVREASDADDNMLLELALACRASAIVTGDKPLLKLHPFREIPIVNAATFLKLF